MSGHPAAPRRRAAVGCLALGGLVLLWAALLFVFHGFDVRIGPFRITAHDHWRPLIAGALLVFAARLLGARIRDDGWRLARAAVAPITAMAAGLRRRRSTDAAVAAILAAAVFAVGVMFGAKVASGSDSWGYLSQAELWRAGDLSPDQPFVVDMPWPNAPLTFAPLGYRPDERAGRTSRLVPVYAPGLPMLLAAAKTIGGQGAMFLVVPAFGALLVLATYGLGARLVSSGAGLAAAWLIATSPVVLFWVVMTMTDVPVAALWAAAMLAVLGGGRWRAGLGGALAGLAMLVRPNLAPLALGLVALAIVQSSQGAGLRRLGAAVSFGMGCLPGTLVVAAFNTRLYGSPARSGYGDLTDYLAWAHVVPNLRRYAGWLIESHTALAAVGLLALFVPWRRIWPAESRQAVAVMAAMTTAVWGFYACYLVFDDWWYLRFLLPSLPFVAIGACAVLRAAARSSGRMVLPAAALIVVVGGLQVRRAATHGAFDIWEGERRYLEAARIVERLTAPRSVILSMQHSGSIRYYAGRVTLVHDQLAPTAIDPAIAHLSARGVHVYLLVEDWELPRFDQRFSGTAAAAATRRPPLAIYRHEGTLFLFDLSAPTGPDYVSEIFDGIDRRWLAVAGPGVPWYRIDGL